jgi:hypothetical protein
MLVDIFEMLYTVNLIGLGDCPAAEESISAWYVGGCWYACHASQRDLQLPRSHVQRTDHHDPTQGIDPKAPFPFCLSVMHRDVTYRYRTFAA